MVGGKPFDPRKAVPVGSLFWTGQAFGLFSLRMWGHPDTSIAATLPLHLVPGLRPRAARVTPSRLFLRSTLVTPARPV
jgi:hypothetical protein